MLAGVLGSREAGRVHCVEDVIGRQAVCTVLRMLFISALHLIYRRFEGGALAFGTLTLLLYLSLLLNSNWNLII